MLMREEVHSSASKRYPFHLETQPLFGACFEPQLDFSPSAYDPLPGKHMGRSRAKKPRYRPVMKRISCSRGYFSVGSNFALWDRTDDPAKCGIARLVRSGGILCDSPNQFP
jgi:hypothetical protein